MKLSGPNLQGHKLKVITHEMGEQGGERGLRLRLFQEVESTNWTRDQKDLLYSALEDATRIHQGDMNGDQPVINHPLRVALRILSENHFNVRDHPELIVGALLHDTVEERAERWSSNPDENGTYPEFDHKEQSFEQLSLMREKALTVIEGKYGFRVKEIVNWLTGDLYPQDIFEHPNPLIRQELKWEQYETGIRKLMQTEDTFGAKVIKVSDFIENFVGGMKHHDEITKRPKMARKYIFLAKDMIAFIEQSTIIPLSSKEALIEKIEKAKREAVDVIQNHINEHPEYARLYDISDTAQARVLGRMALFDMQAA